MESLFFAALDRSVGERGTFLGLECGQDADLRRDVERLLRRHDDSGHFMEDPVWGESVSIPQPEALRLHVDVQPGDHVGRFRLIRELGVGGIGAVWLAERDDAQYRQQVALKIIKRGMDTDDILRRFRNERQVLASLDHPNIAHLLDGGATDDGRSYLVMEYVDGTRIDDYCERRGLSVVDRLRLFLKVCAAVRHAHKHLIVHRDLKPGNILVTNAGEPKLLDFGISKVIESTDTSAAMSETAPHRQAFTPRYASPEQLRGERYTTAGDVYSLGVVLFELLTGRDPYGVTAGTREGLEDAILNIDPARPSFVVRGLDSDLDAIVLKSLAKQPQNRYPTVDALVADIERHLNGEPVLAHAPGAFYQFRKFVGRHRLSFAFAVSIFLLVFSFAVVVGGLAYRLDLQRETAQRRFDETRGLARTLIYDLHDAIAPVRGTLPARRMIVETGLKYLDALASEADDDVSLRLECADGYFRVAELQGTPSGPSLGQTTLAIDACRKGLRIVDRLLDGHEIDDGIRERAAIGSRVMGDLLDASGDTILAVEHFERAIALLEQVLLGRPDDTGVLAKLEKTHFNLATCHERADRYDEAERHFGIVINLIDRRIDAGGDVQSAWMKRGNALAALGHVRVQRGAIDEAVGPLEKATEILASAVDLHPEQANPLRSLAVARMDLGRVGMANSDIESARAAFEFAIGECERLVMADPTDVSARRDLSVAHRLLAKLLEIDGDLEGSLRHFEETIRIRRTIVEEDPNVQMSNRDLAVALDGAGSVLRKMGRTVDALEKHSAAKSHFDAIYASDPTNPRNARSVAVAAYFLGQLYLEEVNRLEPGTPNHHDSIRTARTYLEESREIMTGLRDDGLLRDDESGIVDMLSGLIADCDYGD